MIKGAIFDADGTLLDSMTFWDSAVVNLIKSMGVTPNNNLTEILTPMSMREGAEYLKTEYNLPVSVDEIMDRENRIVEEFYFGNVKMRCGTAEFLQMLKSKNIPMTVASATDKFLIEGALEHLEIRKYFTEILSCTDIGEGKSSPKIYLTACRIMGTSPSETVVFEDSLQALATAKQAGFVTVGLFDVTQQSKQTELKHLSDYYIKGNFDPLEFLKKFF